jgi:uncharacterized membrane protein
MSAKTYKTLMRVIAFTLAALIAFASSPEVPLFVPIVGLMVALVIARLARRMVKEVMSDERNSRIDEKATAQSYRVYTTVTAIGVLVTMMLRSSLPDWVWVAGQALAYSLCALMLLHLAVTKYYEKQL